MTIVLFITATSVIIAGMNYQYNESYELPIGVNTSELELVYYLQNSSNSLESSEVTFDTDVGVQAKSSWGILLTAFGTIRTFLSGGFINNVVGLFGLGAVGDAIVTALTVIFVLSLIFAILYALFKVVI